ncbi:hypothetical protein N7468_006018 [Penicillium chermesinum]|uniref:Suppressor of anucleate metulae protein B n=1 Tax=Penicillium chermesinum TaxID=63820 RepID=A0A9W9TNS8_9EURO|nr:uncharacterized protein N7468_006018 [Penicillium chermesinum]KAJ5233062.1 hypothetical protein N7468_006018 [Penicillium chermesinum]
MPSLSAPPSVTTKTVPRPAPDGMGNGLFATEAIKVGEDVLHAMTPFVAVLDSPRLDDTCAACFGKRQMEGTVDLKACTGCRVVKYCDRTCQLKDWKFSHSKECPIYQSLKGRVLPNNARAILRIVLRANHGKYNAQELELFSSLEMHMDKIQENKEQQERITLTSKSVKEYANVPMSVEDIAQYAARLEVNSFNLTTAMYDRIGLYMHPYAALINHSCDYNATVGFDGEELYVKAVKPINKNEQIFISYIDTTTPHKVRRNELSERYFFQCLCPKCSKGLDTAEDRFLESYSFESADSETALETAERQALELMKKASESDSNPAESIKDLESALHILHATSAWPITRQPYASIRDQLILSCLSASRFSEAFIHAAVRYLRIDTVLYSPAHPVRQVHAWVLAKLAIYLSQSFETHPDDPVRLEEYQLNFHFILCFKKLVAGNFAQVNREFVGQGLDPTQLPAQTLVRQAWGEIGEGGAGCLG